MGGQRLICADGERVDGGSALGDGVCGGAADYGDGEDGTGEGGGWGGKCFFSPLLLLLLSLSFLEGVFLYFLSYFWQGIYIYIYCGLFPWFGNFLLARVWMFFWERGFFRKNDSVTGFAWAVNMNANQWMGAQIGFGPWRSNLRKSSAVEYSGAYIQFPKCTIVFVIVHCSFSEYRCR